MALVHDLLLILVAGMGSQWLAAQLRLPAIVILIAVGAMVGPILGLLTISADPEALNPLVGLGVAIILFEGGMDLELGEFRRVGHGIGRLVILGPPIASVLGALAAHYIGGLSWPVAWVLAAILVVTGPTVILPLLRHARLNKDSAALLKWEGIVNDPMGVLLAVLAYQYFTYDGSLWYDSVLALLLAMLVSLLVGGLSGYLLAQVFKRGWVPEHLKPPLLMVLVLVVYEVTNLVQHEAGLLAVTLMGMVIGNAALGSREQLRQFKENLTIVLVSSLFIVLTARLELDVLLALNLRTLLLLVAFLFLVRPISVWLSTLAAPIKHEDRLLLSWIAPRGIVAAATAGLFGPGLVAAGHDDAVLLLPTVFALIIVTVLAHGFSLGWWARRLRLAASADNGLLIVGASPWSAALAKTLANAKLEVLVVDGVWSRLKAVRHAGIPFYYGEILSEHAQETVSTQHLSLLLCATPNDFYNALVCRAYAKRFGQHRVLQLPTQLESSQDSRRLLRQQRGHLVFDSTLGYNHLNQLVADGWQVHLTPLTEAYDWEDFQAQQAERLVLGALDSNKNLQLYSKELPFSPKSGWQLLTLSPPSVAQKEAAEQPALQ